ncbi:MAG: hypothetical protein GY702_29515 [Desulfobulbaceae bacterium]|nr:hypothetical protein [Desulfobulbaceae bacterium]
MVPKLEKSVFYNLPPKLVLFSLLLLLSLYLLPTNAKAALNYGQAYPDIGTFQTPNGNWSFWVGWDANFSETYTPEGESYAWVVYFAPEAVYLALQSSKSIYSGVNINAGYKYFYGSLNISSGTRLSSLLLAGLHSVGLSKNLFSASTPGIGIGAFSAGNLSFALSSGLTFLKEKATDSLKRGIQIDSGISISYDLISIPLPFSVSLGTDCVLGEDPEELCKFHGFYPIIIYDIEQPSAQSPLDLLLAELTMPATTPQSVEEGTRKMLIKAVQIIQGDTRFQEFIESELQNSQYDTIINQTQQWLTSGDTSNLPENLDLPDPLIAHQTMKPIFGASQIAFELGYQKGCNANPGCSTLYTDCVIEQYCIPGTECIVEITAEEIAALIPGKTALDFEEAWLVIDNSVEQYLVSGAESTEWLQILNGKATYTFAHNSDTPIVLGVKLETAYAPVDTRVELCRRMIFFTPLKGDINGDRSVDLTDTILTLQILTKTGNQSFIDKGADINGDNTIGIEEVIFVLQEVSD